MNSNKETRYDRQFLLKEWNQDKISNAKIFIVGMGAIGIPSAVNFALMGVGTLIICDYDTIEISNLSRQLLFWEEDVGKLKSEVAAKKLKLLNPSINIISYNSKIEDLEPQIFDDVDLMIDGLDNFEARIYLNSIAVDKKKPLIHAGTFGWHGNVQVIIPFQTACMQCQPLIPESRLKKACTPRGKMRKEEEPEEEKHFPSINTISNVISSIQSQEGIKILLNVGKVLEEFLFYDGLTQTFTYMPLSKNIDCVVCGKNRLMSKKFAIDLNETVQQVKNRIIITYKLVDQIKITYMGKILEETTKLNDISIKEDDFFYVFDKSMKKPLKLQLTF